jgi:hypothetical protein
MIQIYSRQAQSFLVPDAGLYKRTPPHQMIPYMVRMSGAIRGAAFQHRSAAIKLVQANMHEAWALIHRHLRPYFFQPIDAVIDAYQGSPIELPDLVEKPNIHEAMHFCFDTLLDFDRLTILLQTDRNVEDSSDVIFSCWNAISRATSRVEGLERRIISGKAFNGGV